MQTQQKTGFVLDRKSTEEELALFIDYIRPYVAGADAAVSFRWRNDLTIRGGIRAVFELGWNLSPAPLMRLEIKKCVHCATRRVLSISVVMMHNTIPSVAVAEAGHIPSSAIGQFASLKDGNTALSLLLRPRCCLKTGARTVHAAELRDWQIKVRSRCDWLIVDAVCKPQWQLAVYLYLILVQSGHRSPPIEISVEFRSKDEVELSFLVTTLALYFWYPKHCSITTLTIPRGNMQPNRQLPQYQTRRKGMKLDMIKCRFCRDAKQKCDFKGRQWPEQKCARCLDKNLQCSEGQRAKRMSKIRNSPQIAEVFIEPQLRAIVLASKPIAGMAQPLPIIDNPLNIENITHVHVHTEKRNINVKESLILMSIHTVLMLALQELKALGDQMWSISCNDPYHQTPASGLPGLENIFSSFKSFACDLTTRVLRIGAGEKLISEAYAALETDYSERKITWSENDVPRHLEGSIARFQELGHRGFAHVLHMKRLLDRPKLTDHEAQLLVDTRHAFLNEVREILYKYSLQRSVPEWLCNTQIFIPSRFLKHLTIRENVQHIHIPDCLGRSISHILSDAGHTVDWPTDHIHHVDALGRSGLYIACQNGDEVGVKKSIANEANVYEQAMNGLTPFHIAACMGRTTICALLWNRLNGSKETSRSLGGLRDRSGRHPLLWAALCGRYETVARLGQLCYEKGHDPTLDTDDFGCNAVILAACGGHGKVVQFLLDFGFPADVQDSNERTAFWYAAQGGHEAVMKLLCEHVTVGHRDRYGQTPLAEAARQGHTNALKYLLSLNQYTELLREPILIRVDPDSRDNAGKSALVHAAENAHLRCVGSLLNQGHDPFCSERSESHTEDMLVASRMAFERQDWSTLRALSRGNGRY